MSTVDLNLLFQLRLTVGRFGEMDIARWWNTRGLLGPNGAVVLKRGFPVTHYFAQAHIVFEVARRRTRELFHPPGCVTLWKLSAEVEDAFEERWQTWLDEDDRWAPVFESLAAMKDGDLLEQMIGLDLLSARQRDAAARLRRSAQGRAVSITGPRPVTDEVVTLLAAGFACGEVGNPAIPYARMEA